MPDVMRHAPSFSCPSGISAVVGRVGVGWGGGGLGGGGSGHRNLISGEEVGCNKRWVRNSVLEWCQRCKYCF